MSVNWDSQYLRQQQGMGGVLWKFTYKNKDFTDYEEKNWIDAIGFLLRQGSS